MKPVVFMFSGQGSHYYGMGKELYENHPVFRTWLQRMDDVAFETVGVSIVDTVYDAGKNQNAAFDQTTVAGLAIVMVEYALAQVLLDMGIGPDYLLGSSLGEVTATIVAEADDWPAALKSLAQRMQLYDRHCAKGGMIGILAPAGLYETTPELYRYSELAGINFDAHFVVSCRAEHIPPIEHYLRANGIAFQTLNVSQAFHSSLLDPVKALFQSSFPEKYYRAPKIPLLSCMQARAITAIDQDYFWDIVRKPMLFQQTVRELEQQGDYCYLDLGPSGTLANFVKYNLGAESRSEYYAIMTPFGGELKRLRQLQRLFSNHQTERRKMKTYLFPGQGSQAKGMGATLFDAFPELTRQADAILGYSIKELCVQDPQRQLQQTQFTQPALYVVNALAYRQKIAQNGAVPDFVAGHSLGEYNALECAGVFSFEDGLKLVKKRGELMSRAPKGAMAAVVGSTEQDIAEILAGNGLTAIDIANYNAPSQTVISGLEEDVCKALACFEQAQIMCIPLNTGGAFHSRYMAAAAIEFAAYLKEFRFSRPQIPVISNIHARPYREEDVARNLAEQIAHSVQWLESMRYLMAQGEMQFEEIGPGEVLTKLIKTIQKQATPLLLEEKNPAPPSVAANEGEGSRETAAPNAWEREIATVQEKIARWNKNYPIGTKVTVQSYDQPLETRTQAMLLFGHRAAIYMQGYNGYFDLDEIKPV